MNQYQQSEATSARRWIPFQCFDDDSADGYAPKTGLTFSDGELKIAKAGAAVASATGYASVVEAGNGWYWYPASASELDTLGPGLLIPVKTDVYASATEFMVVAYDPFSATELGLTNLDATVSSRVAAADYEDIDTWMDTADSVETGLTLRGFFRLAAAVLFGKTSGAGTGTETFRAAVADGKVRVTTTISGNNRTAITTDQDA